MALLQISEPGAVARSAPAAPRRRHRPRHHPFARRRGAQRRRRVPARRRRAGRSCRRSCATCPAAGPRSASAPSPRRSNDPANTIVSVKRFMGRGLADVACRDAALRLRRRAGHGAAQHRGRREVAGRGLGRDPRDAAPARRGHLRRRSLRRGRHRAGVLRRCAAPGHQGRGRAGRPERAAPDQRADRGRDRLRAGQRVRGHLRGLRPGRRHLRHLDAAADARACSR